jgi:antitoxin (DNA-binding transcriptional repressor) of toxin-antitoxin stability system
MPADVFKTNCLAIMDEAQAKREIVVITKHGELGAKLVPVDTRVDETFGFSTAKVRSLATWFPRRFPRKSGAIVGDPGGRPVVVWLALEPANISKKARAAIE